MPIVGMQQLCGCDGSLFLAKTWIAASKECIFRKQKLVRVRGDFNRQRNLRGVSPGLGRRGFEKCWICGVLGPGRLLGRANEAKIRYPEKTRAMQGRKRGHFAPLITGLWPKISLNRRGEERLFFNTKFLTP